MKKLFLKASALVLFIGVCLIMTVSAYANSDIKLTYVGEGVSFSIYKTGALDSGGAFVPEEAFKNYNVDFEDESCALTLEIYIERDGIEPLMSAVTNSSSIVYFNDLPAGQYLILGEDATIGNKVYTAQPVLTYVYDYSDSQIEIVGKYSSSDTSGGGGSVYPETTTETTTSSSSSDGDTEETTSSSSDSSDGSEPSDSDGGGSSDSSEDSTSSSDTSSASDDSSADNSSAASDDSASISDNSADISSVSGEQSSGGIHPGRISSTSLPQTGQLWYPVPILLWLGIIFLVLGIRRKSSNT